MQRNAKDACKRTHVNLVDLVKSFLSSIYYLVAKIGFDTAENEPFKFHNFSSLQGFHFHRAVVSKARAKQAAKKASPRSAAEEAKVEVAGIQTLQFMSSEISSICERCTLL